MYKTFIKPLLFLIQPEKAHYLSTFILKITHPFLGWLYRLYSYQKPNSFQLLKLSLSSRVGLAAGFDKNGKYYHSMSSLGFGFIELGTVTPNNQEGNSLPRLFRIPDDKGLINRMGFNNLGVDQLVHQLEKNKRPKNTILGGNIGKNNATHDTTNALKEYIYCFSKIHSHVDYIVVNISCPNIGATDEIQQKPFLIKLFTELQQINTFNKPLFIKIGPDLAKEELNNMLAIVRETKISGIIATNTSIRRDGLTTSSERIKSIGKGGLSGAPIFNESLRTIAYLAKNKPKNCLLIGVGGINSADSAEMMIDAGADLIQIYAGLIYEGPSLIRKINKRLHDKNNRMST